MSQRLLRLRKHLASAMVLALSASMLVASPVTTEASSHREAPLIAGDAQADNTDVYAFRSPDSPDTVTLIASFNPFEEPAGGPNFFKFGDDVIYAIYVDSDGNAEPDITYEFDFQTQTVNPNTFLYSTGPITSLTDPDFNVRQTYTLTRIENGQRTVLGSNLAVPPNNVGPGSTPNYESLFTAGIHNVGTNMKVFAGQTDDAFFVDVGGLFDLLTIRVLPGNAGGGVDSLKGFNAQSIALQVPINQLTKQKNQPTTVSDPNAVIGVWSATLRPQVRVLKDDGNQEHNGNLIQVSRLGSPLVNEVVIPLANKDRWNASRPQNDAQFANYVTNPELGKLLKALYNIAVPPQGDFGTPDQRDDLIAIFLTGIPGFTQPANVKPSEQIRLNVAVPVTVTPNRMGVLGGDNQGYPNGRRLADDVTDISIQAVAGAAYPLFHSSFTPDPLANKLGDGVDLNDAAFRCTFPYLAAPWSGFESVPHGAGSGVASPSCSAGGSSSAGASTSSAASSIVGSSASSVLMSSVASSVTASSVGALTCNGQAATVYVQNGVIVGGNSNGQTYNGFLNGTGGHDVIVGTSGNDEINGFEGNDVICGRGGNDAIQGSQDSDVIFGEDGDDRIGGGQGGDALHGDAGNDQVWGDSENDSLFGEAGNDMLNGADGDDTLNGGLDTDALNGSNGFDVCTAGETNEACESL